MRALRQWDPPRVAGAGLALAVVLLVAAYGFAAIESGLTPGGVVAAVAAVAIAACGLLYAFRLGAGGHVD
jgi:hypothetical protein